MWSDLVAHTAVSTWLLGVLVISVTVLAAVVGHDVWKRRRRMKSRRTYLDYTEDEFLGMRWRWKYHPDGGIYHPVSYCPLCDCRLSLDDTKDGARRQLLFECKRCGDTRLTFETSDDVVEQVHRLIQKNIRTAAWKRKPETA